MIEIVLKNIVELYYPVGISSMSNYDRYIQTPEFKNLTEKTNIVFLASENMLFKEKLLKEFRKNQILEEIRDFTLESFDKCLTFKMDIFEGNILYQIRVNISVLVPYYLVYVLKNEINLETNQWVSYPERDKYSEKNKFENHLNLISNIIESETNYNKFPSFLINKIIPNVSYSDIETGNFTYLNAFFLKDIKL